VAYSGDYTFAMKAVDADLVGDGVLIIFSDGSAVVFDSEFLYAHRRDSENLLLPKDDPEDTTTG
jgi:hypothetical protein